MPTYRIEARDVPAASAARRLGLDLKAFLLALPNLIERGFPRADPDTGNFDLVAIDRWQDTRHPHLMGAAAVGAVMGARDAATVVSDRISRMAGDRRG